MKGLALVAVVCLGCSHEISPLVDPDAKDEVAFQAARAEYDAMRFAAAAGMFERFVDDFPDSARHAEAWYLAGRSRYEVHQYTEAVDVLLAMRAAHPTSRFIPNAHYYTGRSEYEVK